MTELWNAYWPMILVAIAIGLVTGLIIFRRPRQKVMLTRTETPVRPHMAVPKETAMTTATAVAAERPIPEPSAHQRDGPEGNGVDDELAAAASDVVGQVVGAQVHDQLPGAGHGHTRAEGDDLQRMKGVGPKLASLLAAKGLTRFDQIAALDDAELQRLDADMGAFQGRLARDRVVEQAGYLARGDQTGYEAAFGRL